MAHTMDGVITLVQEGRFQMTDAAGVSHLFVLGHNAATETEQLRPLERSRVPVRVSYKEPRNIIGNVATAIRRIG